METVSIISLKGSIQDRIKQLASCEEGTYTVLPSGEVEGYIQEQVAIHSGVSLSKVSIDWPSAKLEATLTEISLGLYYGHVFTDFTANTTCGGKIAVNITLDPEQIVALAR